MTPFEYLVVVLATVQAIEIYHHGDIFAERRATLETREDWQSRMQLCPFCLSTWVALALTLWCFLAFWSILMLPIYALAVARGANLVNDLTRSSSRTPHD